MIKSDTYKYIKFDSVLSSVKSDLHVFESNNLILEDRLLKVIYYCNDKLGVKLNKSKQVLLEVKNYKANLPQDFYKIEMMFATCVTEIPNQLQLIPGNKAEYISCPTNCVDICEDKCAGVNTCRDNIWLIRQPQIQKEIEIRTYIPLAMSKRCTDSCTSYSPSSSINSEYNVDLTEDLINVNFKEGQIFLCYLGTMEDEDGTPMIPFHPLLNPYYEWSLKRKILEDIFMNSEADVEKKLQYAIKEQGLAYIDAWQFTGLPEHRELEKNQQRYAQDYYNKWYKLFK